MAATRTRVRKGVRWMATLLFAALLILSEGASVLDHARAAGWSEPASERIAASLRSASNALAGPAFYMIFGLVLGIAATLWIERLSGGRPRHAVARGAWPASADADEASLEHRPGARSDDTADELAAIDAALGLVGSGMKLDKALRRARQLHGAWQKEISSGRYEEYLELIKACRQECWKLFLDVDRIHRDSEAYDELRSIMSADGVLLQGQSNKFFHAFANFVENVKMLGSSPSREHLRLLQPCADALSEGITEFERWRSGVNDALLDRRQEI
jgi:hypothetical protein